MLGFEFERLSVVFLSYSVLLVPDKGVIFEKLFGLRYTVVCLKAFLTEFEFFYGS